MADETVFDQFSATLRGAFGLPDGVTTESVRKQLEETYAPLLDAISEYAERLNYQKANLSIESDFDQIERKTSSGTLIITLQGPNGTANIPLRINQHGLVASKGSLVGEAPGGMGQWPLADLDKFIKCLGDEILRAVGAIP